mmetsp:Transcript_2468/g.6153  ORF Transcript_2468/g.6153 Transcript_2468/m.6153 type:complete len:211 (-) Transcript_2468:665-1297(-)
MFHLQRCLLEPKAAYLMLLGCLVEHSFVRLCLFVQLASIRSFLAQVKRDALCITLECIQVLPQCFQPDLCFLDRRLQLLMLYLSIQELVHDVHNICETCNVPYLLKAILCGLRKLHLLEADLLQAIPLQLLNGIELPQPASRGIEGFVCCSQTHFVAPCIELRSAPVGLHPVLELALHHLTCFLAGLSLNIRISLQCIQLLLLCNPADIR